MGDGIGQLEPLSDSERIILARFTDELPVTKNRIEFLANTPWQADVFGDSHPVNLMGDDGTVSTHHFGIAKGYLAETLEILESMRGLAIGLRKCNHELAISAHGLLHKGLTTVFSLFCEWSRPSKRVQYLLL